MFYTVVISLLAMAGLSAYVLYWRLCHRPSAPGFAWLKGFVLLPLWLLTLIWTGLAVAMGIFVGGMTGSLLFPLLGLGLVPAFFLLTLGLYFWVSSRTMADTGAPLVPVIMLTVYSVQRLWIS